MHEVPLKHGQEPVLSVVVATLADHGSHNHHKFDELTSWIFFRIDIGSFAVQVFRPEELEQHQAVQTAELKIKVLIAGRWRAPKARAWANVSNERQAF